MGLTLGRRYKTRKGEARLVGVEGEWLVWQRARKNPQGDLLTAERFRTKREGAEVRVPRRGTVEVKT